MAGPTLAAIRSPSTTSDAKISAKLENKTDKEVYLRADVRANYGKVMDAVDQIRAAGVSKLGLLTEKKDHDDTTGK